MADDARRVAWHGMVLVLAGLLMGIVVPQLRNPRMGLSAHVATVMNGILVVALGALWDRLALGARAEAATRWLLVVSSYLLSVALFAAAMLGTSASTPLAGAGHAGTPLAEAAVTAALMTGAPAMLVACALVLYGLGRRGTAVPGRMAARD
jgi:(hydroxyamino)benzene mutase